jgi:hypothetical protein
MMNNLKYINRLGGIEAEVGENHTRYLAPGTPDHDRALAGNFGPIAPYDGPTEEQEAHDRALREAREARAAAYAAEADPLFFKAQRGEATEQDWRDKVADIRARYPYPED